MVPVEFERFFPDFVAKKPTSLMLRFSVSSWSVIIQEIQERHSRLGAKVVGGFASSVAPLTADEGNFVVRGDLCLSSSGSISDSEMAFTIGLSEIVKPRRILVIGNSYGLSTLLLSLANPEAVVVAIDKFRTKGLQFTEKLCEGLNVKAIQGSTPDQLESIVMEHLDGEVDLVLVDAVHENSTQSAEFRILAPLLSNSSIVVFHDVLSCDLLPSVRELAQEFPEYIFKVLPKTTSGLAVSYKSNQKDLSGFLAYYGADAQLVSDFQYLLASRWGNPRASFFEDVKGPVSFPPHPQI